MQRLGRQPHGKRQHLDITMDLKQTGCEDVHCIHPDQNRNQWRGLVNSEMLGISEVAEQLLVSQEDFSFVELMEAGNTASRQFSCLTRLKFIGRVKFILSNMMNIADFAAKRFPSHTPCLDVAPVARNIAWPKPAGLQSSQITTAGALKQHRHTTRPSKYRGNASLTPESMKFI
jgi:hypothetical protein